MQVCDGCGASVDERHIRRRIERLELATRWRPIHIHLLLIDASPLACAEDYFYALSARSAAGDQYFRELASAAGAPDVNAPTEAVLSEFQRRGFFLTSAVECPTSGADDLTAALQRLAPTVVRRVQSSYKPKQLALISEATGELIEPLRAAGWGERMILDGGAPFAGARLGERLAAALAKIG